MGRRGQGGDINVQSAFYMIALGTASSVIIGCLEAKRGAFDSHREWMLRELRPAMCLLLLTLALLFSGAWFYNGVTITTRLTALISSQIITIINSYYSVSRCQALASFETYLYKVVAMR